MTQDNRLDPAEIMRDIRRRVLEEVSHKRADEIVSEVGSGRAENIRSTLEDISMLSTGSPWREEYLGTKYQFPLKTLALKVRRILQAEIRWTLESFVDRQRRLNLSTASVLRSIWESVQEELQELVRRSAPDLSHMGHRYVAFEEVGGSSSLVRSRQTPFLEHFRGRRNVLDIGCGRGVISATPEGDRS